MSPTRFFCSPLFITSVLGGNYADLGMTYRAKPKEAIGNREFSIFPEDAKSRWYRAVAQHPFEYQVFGVAQKIKARNRKPALKE